MAAFVVAVNRRFNLDLKTNEVLCQWSVERILDFWETFLSCSGIRLHDL